MHSPKLPAHAFSSFTEREMQMSDAQWMLVFEMGTQL